MLPGGFEGGDGKEKLQATYIMSFGEWMPEQEQREMVKRRKFSRSATHRQLNVHQSFDLVVLQL